ncbi:nodulation protein NfeD [Haloferula chungangensis]|uniref:Nodulation protein NfeD n=1 Tax=Haloferula chungangensis TaxID=1048331 RepID=A0ABW2L6Y0_9BACT
MKALFFLILTALFCLAEEAPEQRVWGKSDEVSLTGKVVVLPIGQKDLINKQAFRFWQRMLERAVEEEARAVVLELDTPGGLAFDTKDIITDDFGKLEIPLIAWVKREALSAGALISFSADRIYMAPGTIIGSAGLINSTGAEMDKVLRAKLESAFEASLRPVVEKKGHNLEVLRAMMFIDEDKERTFGSVTVRKNGLLNLTAKEAVEVVDGKPLLAAGIAESLEEVLRAEGMENAEVIRPNPTGFEKFAWWIAAISPLLIAVGIGAAYFEFKAPGFGLFGFLSLGVFTLFFFGNNVAGNLAGYELMAVFLVGMVLVVLEILVIPGGIAGIIGGLMVLGSLWFAMADRVEFERLDEGEGVASNLGSLLIGPGLMLGLGILGAIGLMLLFMRFLPDIPLFRGLVAKEALPSGQGGAPKQSFVGAIATALTDLRPTGTIMVDGVKKDAISNHGLIEKGSQVRVLEEGMTFHVEPVEDGEV